MLRSKEKTNENMDGSDLLNPELLDMLRRMAYIAEYRKTNTLSHLERIRGYCFVIATGLGLTATEAKIISYASQLHDIGEIALPDGLHNRAGQLTPFEWEQVKRHPVVGADLLKDSPSSLLQVAGIIALTHHERWDGSGYPRGLQGEDIPLSGRICALADVFDALTTKRAYKAEMSIESALEIIQESSGQFFDPAVVTAFEENIGEIKKIRTMNI
jgi:cyclic di-GMP phosphodiesterase